MCRLPHHEIEDLATDIWLECWELEILPNHKLMNWRIIDAIVTKARHVGLQKGYAHGRKSETYTKTEHLIASELMERASLSVSEQETIFAFYWLGLPLNEIALISHRPTRDIGRDLTRAIQKLSFTAQRGT